MANCFIKTEWAMIWEILGEWFPPPAVVLYRKDTPTLLYFNLPFPYQETHKQTNTCCPLASPCHAVFSLSSLLNSTVSLPQASPDLWHVVMFVLWLSSPLVVTSSTSQKVGVDVGAIQHKNLSVRMMIVETTCRTRGNIQSIYEGKVRSDFMHALSKSVVSLSRLQMSARRVWAYGLRTGQDVSSM